MTDRSPQKDQSHLIISTYANSLKNINQIYPNQLNHHPTHLKMKRFL